MRTVYMISIRHLVCQQGGNTGIDHCFTVKKHRRYGTKSLEMQQQQTSTLMSACVRQLNDTHKSSLNELSAFVSIITSGEK